MDSPNVLVSHSVRLKPAVQPQHRLMDDNFYDFQLFIFISQDGKKDGQNWRSLRVTEHPHSTRSFRGSIE